MAAGTAPDTSSPEWQWFVVGRWQEYSGEARANLLRIAAVGGFYVVELVNFYLLGEGDAAFHRTATGIAVAWTLMSLAVLLCLRRRIFPALLKYVTTALDLVLLTCLALAVKGATGGAHSSLVFIYFLIIALAALRFSLHLVWFATGGALLAYLALVGATDRAGHGHWFDADHAVPVVEQLMVLLSLVLTGIIVGQVVRRARALAEEYCERIRRAEGDDA